MQNGSFLKAFDQKKKFTHTVDMNAETSRIQQEQEALYKKKFDLQIKEEKTKLEAEYEKKIKLETEKLKQHYLQKNIDDAKKLKVEYDKNQAQYIKKYTDIIAYFLNHHLKKLNKHLINNQIKEKIAQALKHEYVASIDVNEATKLALENYLEEEAFIFNEIHINKDLDDYQVIINITNEVTSINLTEISAELEDIMMHLLKVNEKSAVDKN